ncbi:PREDICTED: dehydrogenase/reductase SDR family member 13-like [Cyprinodon variegatus]|uniref:dehydrogenase/reductase SDR family member 13-like n=1 Tax=Cyprinodon variegatus TaxID=28743 RepID=UPI000742BC9F|nr:PREDICTED: dehydrogenase/reductase SDR family member 13-like [Cyprinodon variegatus]
MSVVLLVVGVVIGVAYIYHHIVVKGERCTSQAKLHGKTVIVTGSNTGIGKTTAIDLARRGARVILACRCKQRGEAALEEIKRESGSNQVVFMQLDLGSLKSVRTFAETFLKSEPRLDMLINNAGRTAQLLSYLTISHSIISYLIILRAVLRSNSKDQLTKYNSFFFTGAISSELGRNTSLFLQVVLKPITTFFFKNTVQGCQTTLHCALQEGIEPLSGRYFSNCTVRNLFAKARDDAAARKLWEISERFCDLP